MINIFSFKHKVPYYMKKKAATQKGVSLLIPCYNEQSIIQTAIMGVERLDYSNMEIIYINDGSTDHTMELLYKLLRLTPTARKPAGELSYKVVRGFYQSSIYPNVYVIDKINGGKADSLNAASDYAAKELVVTLDADSILDQKALHVINSAFQNEDIIAAGGMVHVLQGRSFSEHGDRASMKLKHIVRFQILEYLKGFYIYKASLAKLDAMTVISGAFGVFSKKVLFEVGGYRNTIGEDIDITLRFQEYILKNKGKKMLFVPEAVCYTECPENWRDLFKQRVRWQKAFVDCVIQYRSTLVRSFLFHSVSFFFVVDAFFTGTVSTYFAAGSFLALAFNLGEGMQAMVTIYLCGSLFCNILYNFLGLLMAKRYGTHFKGHDKVRLLTTIILDLLVFRFISLYFIMYGSFAYFFNKHDWNKVARTGREYQLDQVS
jgi:biofilm PGA synthesis N-glycosyltransferase PgaC